MYQHQPCGLAGLMQLKMKKKERDNFFIYHLFMAMPLKIHNDQGDSPNPLFLIWLQEWKYVNTLIPGKMVSRLRISSVSKSMQLKMKKKEQDNLFIY